eukprot:SAG31_NODE_9137_length_1328_cov_1.371847_2_plen_181_part_01
MNWTNRLRAADLLGPDHIAVAASFDLRKIFALDCRDCSVHLLSRTRRGTVLTPATPAAPAGDGVLGWLECLARRLQSGVYQAERLVPEESGTDGISIYTRQGPSFSQAVTRGVRATAMCVYAPEVESFIYSVRFRLLGPGEAVRVVTFSFLCPLLEKYGTFIARCNALIEKVSPCVGGAGS